MFTVVMVLYAAMAVGTIVSLRIMSARWKREDARDESVPYGPSNSDAELVGSGAEA
jgi:hypothetical protein